jgi:hypothetical protein
MRDEVSARATESIEGMEGLRGGSGAFSFPGKRTGVKLPKNCHSCATYLRSERSSKTSAGLALTPGDPASVGAWHRSLASDWPEMRITAGVCYRVPVVGARDKPRRTRLGRDLHPGPLPGERERNSRPLAPRRLPGRKVPSPRPSPGVPESGGIDALAMTSESAKLNERSQFRLFMSAARKRLSEVDFRRVSETENGT